jgi:GntR family transcriptional regulator, carbon starvation induced regulator
MKKEESTVLATNVVSARSLIEAAYSALREDILSGRLAPGEKLRVEMLKDRYNVGASTLREALTRLVGEALVTSEEQRGFRVAAVSLEDFADLTKARQLIEVEALRQAILEGDDTWEAGVVAAYHRLSKVEEKLGSNPIAYSDEFEDRNRDFHRALLAACQSRWLHHMHGILFQQSERYRRISLAHREVPRDIHAEHAALFEAVLARDVDQACRVANDHINRTLQVVSQVFSVSGAK